MFNNQFTSAANNGGPGEDQNYLPALEGLQCDDDLFIQSDNEVTPMTDIEDSSGDEVCDEDYLWMHMKSVHDEVKSSHDDHQLSNPRTTNQIKHVMTEVKKTPVVNVTRRDGTRRNKKEKLDVLKRNLIRTWCSSPHGDSVIGWDNGDGDGVDGDDDVDVDDGGGDHDGGNGGNDDASESVEPDLKPLETDPFSMYPSGTDQRVPPQGEAKTKIMLLKQSSPADAKQKKERGAPSKGNSEQPASPNHDKEKKKRVKKGRHVKECPVCYKRFSSSGLKKHMKKSHIYTCEICDIRIKDLVMFQGHMREHAGEPTPYWCDLCDKRFDRFATLDKHMKRHSLKGRWECSKCGKVFNRRDNYFTHLKLHQDPNNNKCEVCGRQYASAANLRKHIVVHLEEKPLECPVCEKRFNFKSPYDYHMRKHTLELVTCKICGLKCYSNFALAVHMNIHTGTKPYVCKYCGKRFAQLSTKSGHEMTHSNPNKNSLDKDSEEQRTKNMLESFDCDQCLMSFISLELLNGHMKTHATSPKKIPDSKCIKPHSCGICGMPFLSVSGLRKHRIKKHPEHVGVGKGRYSSLGKNLNPIEMTSADITSSTVKKGATTGSVRNPKKDRIKKHPDHVAVGKKPTKQQKTDVVQSFDCDQCLISFASWELFTLHSLKTHPTIPKEIPSLDSDKAKDPKTSKQKSDSKKYPQSSMQRSDSKTDQPKSKQRLDRRKDLLTSKQRSDSNKDLQTSQRRLNPAKDLPTSKQRLDPRKNSMTFKQRSDQKLDLSKSKQGSTDGKAEHKTGKKKCMVCGKCVTDFNRHMKLHGEREYVCRVCGMRFHMAYNLKRHLRLHTGEMPFRCKISGERFMKAEALKKHKARQEGSELKKKFECPTCGKKFLDNYHLRQHSKVHMRWPKNMGQSTERREIAWST